MMELLAMEESIASHSMMKQYIAFEPSAPNNLLCRCYSVVDVVLLVCCCCATVVVLFLLCYIVRYHRLCATVLSLWFVVVMLLSLRAHIQKKNVLSVSIDWLLCYHPKLAHQPFNNTTPQH